MCGWLVCLMLLRGGINRSTRRRESGATFGNEEDRPQYQAHFPALALRA